MSKTSDDSLLAAGAGDKIVLFEMINSFLAILTFVENTLVWHSPITISTMSHLIDVNPAMCCKCTNVQRDDQQMAEIVYQQMSQHVSHETAGHTSMLSA